MRLLCPNCQQAITIPETEAGKATACPLCAQSFTAPQLYASPSFEPSASGPLLAGAPATSAPAAPTNSTATAPSPAPPLASAPGNPAASPGNRAGAGAAETSQPPEPSARSATGPTLPEGYRKLWSLPLSREVCHWTVPICLTLIFFLTFFRWIGFYPAGYPAYTQNPWQAMFGLMSVDPVGEKVFGQEHDLQQGLHASWWLIPYVLFLVFGVLLAWAEPVLKRLRIRPVPPVENLLRFRPAALAACAGLCLFLLLIQSAVGFGLENALSGRTNAEFAEERKQARTPEEYQKLHMNMAVVQAKYEMTGTDVLSLVILLHFVALAAVLGETLLIHRGAHPPPRVGVLW